MERTMQWLAMGLAGLLLFSAGNRADAQKQHLHLDPDSTEVHFTLKDTLHTVHGTFHLKAGDVFFDPKTGEAHGLIEVETASGASGNETRDGKMKKGLSGCPSLSGCRLRAAACEQL